MKKLLVPLLILTMSCAWFSKPEAVPSNYVEYSGTLDGNYAYSSEMLRVYTNTQECVGAIDIPIPLPKLVVMGCPVYEGCDVNVVKCNDKNMEGCYDPTTSTVILPAKTTLKVIEHEFIHHFCNHEKTLNCGSEETAAKHASPLFDKCSGIQLMK